MVKTRVHRAELRVLYSLVTYSHFSTVLRSWSGLSLAASADLSLILAGGGPLAFLRILEPEPASDRRTLFLTVPTGDALRPCLPLPLGNVAEWK